jgi:hypothetical protein
MMTDVIFTDGEKGEQKPLRKTLRWIPGVIFRPRRMFAELAEENRSTWFWPLAVLAVVMLLGVAANGSIKHANSMTGEISLPPNFQYYSPEMQERFMQATQATSSRTFLYVLPAVLRVSGIFTLWLITGGLLHLILTMFGGRAAGGTVLNVAAWAAMPFAVRETVRFFYVLFSRHLIVSQGLSGFAPTGTGTLALLLSATLALVDIYLLWHMALVFVGTRAASGLSFGKNLSAVAITFVLLVGLQALVGYGLARLGIAVIGSPIAL